MSNKFVSMFMKTTLALIAVTFFSGTAFAQYTPSAQGPVNPFDNYSWEIQPRNVKIDIDSSVPASCMFTVILGSQKWNSVSDFNVKGFTMTGNPDSHPDIKYKFGSVRVGNVAETRAGRVNAWTLIEGNAVAVVSDATVTISNNFWAAGKLSCTEYNFSTFEFENSPTPTQYNLENTTSHEIGHVAGLAHQGGSSCFMNVSGGPGSTNFTGASTTVAPCSSEIASMKILH